MKQIDYENKGLQKILAYHRQNPDIKTLMKTCCKRFNTIQSVIIYLLNTYNIREARGYWLDYIGNEIGTTRGETDYGNYFVVNRPHINTQKLFYFLTSGMNPTNTITLDDTNFAKKIYAYIKANTASGTIEDIISAMKIFTAADVVELSTDAPAEINIHLTGSNVTQNQNITEYCTQILSGGTYLKEIRTND